MTTRITVGTFRAIALILCAAFLVAPATGAWAEKREKPKPQTKKVKAVGQKAFKMLNAAHEALGEERYGDALAELQDMKDSSRLNDHERALMWQTYGYIYSTQGKYKQAIGAFEECVALDSLPETAQAASIYNLAQLYAVTEQYGKAVSTFRKWFETAPDPPAEAHYMFAIALVQSGNDNEALQQIQIALERATKPKEPWLQLALSLNFKKKRYSECAAILEELVTLFPKKQYWTQLSAVYSQRQQNKKSLGALEMAYIQGLLDKDRELTNLAHLYLFNEVPYKAARVIQKGMAEGTIKGNERSYELLANAWLNAREREKALVPLERAASRSGDGKLFLRLAQLQIDREKWGPAQESLRRAIEKGELTDQGSAVFLIGVAAASDEDWEAAREAFEDAKEFDDRKRAAQEWLVHIDAEEAAIEEAEAEAAAEAAAAAAAAELQAAAAGEGEEALNPVVDPAVDAPVDAAPVATES